MKETVSLDKFVDLLEVNGTIILREQDILPFSERPYTLYDFNLTTDQRNKASNIIFIDEKKVIHLLKLKKFEAFKESNKTILNY